MQQEYSYHHRRLARTLRSQLTPAEKHLWQYLRKRQLLGFRFRRQTPVGRYITDFVCFELKLIVELDGEIHLAQQQYDRLRDEWFGCQGFHVLRFSNDYVLNQTDDALLMVKQIIKQRMNL